MSPERRRELEVKAFCNQHGLEPKDAKELFDEIDRLKQDLANSRLDFLSLVHKSHNEKTSG